MSFFKNFVKRKAKSLVEKQEETEKMKLTIGPDGKVQQTPTEEQPVEETKVEEPKVEEPKAEELAEQEAPTEERMDPAVLREMEMQARAQAAMQHEEAYRRAVAQQQQINAQRQAEVMQVEPQHESIVQPQYEPPQFNQEAMHQATEEVRETPNPTLVINLIENQQLSFVVTPEELNVYMSYCEKCIKEKTPIIIENTIIPLSSVITVGYTE